MCNSLAILCPVPWRPTSPSNVSDTAPASPTVPLSFLPSLPAVVEFCGGPGTWVTRTYTAARNAGAFCNGNPIQASLLPHWGAQGSPDQPRRLLLRCLQVAAAKSPQLEGGPCPCAPSRPLPPGQQGARRVQLPAGHRLWLRARRVLGAEHAGAWGRHRVQKLRVARRNRLQPCMVGSVHSGVLRVQPTDPSAWSRHSTPPCSPLLLQLFKHYTDVSQGVRRLGSAAIDMCHVASGG